MKQQVFFGILGACLLQNARTFPQMLSGDPIYDNEWDGRTVKTKQWCDKLHLCSPGGGKVCGWDGDNLYLAEFENICVMYRANCRNFGSFLQVDMVVCETKKQYDNDHKSELFEWEHILTTTVATESTSTGIKKTFVKKNSTNLPGMVKLV